MDENIGALLSQVARLMRRDFDARARSIGVTRPQWQVLAILSEGAGINQGQLADLLEVEPITAGRMIDRLQEANLVERRADPLDRRAWRLHLTEHGEDRLGQLRPAADAMLASALAGMDNAGRAAFAGALATIRTNLSRKSG